LRRALLFDVPMLGSFVLLTAMVLLFITATLTVGFTFSTIARSQMQSMQMTMFYFLPNILLSGFMFPFRGMPRWAQMLGEVLPLTHFLRIVRGIMLKGATLARHLAGSGRHRGLHRAGHGGDRDAALPPDHRLSGRPMRPCAACNAARGPAPAIGAFARQSLALVPAQCKSRPAAPCAAPPEHATPLLHRQPCLGPGLALAGCGLRHGATRNCGSPNGNPRQPPRPCRCGGNAATPQRRPPAPAPRRRQLRGARRCQVPHRHLPR
jgi:hypothetical protein